MRVHNPIAFRVFRLFSGQDLHRRVRSTYTTNVSTTDGTKTTEWADQKNRRLLTVDAIIRIATIPPSVFVASRRPMFAWRSIAGNELRRAGLSRSDN